VAANLSTACLHSRLSGLAGLAGNPNDVVAGKPPAASLTIYDTSMISEETQPQKKR
jgi:uncharacterized protein YvpB